MEAVVAAKVLDHVLELLQSSKQKIQEKAWSLLGNLACHSPESIIPVFAYYLQWVSHLLFWKFLIHGQL